MSEDISPELVNIYLEDARGHLEALEHCLLSLERDGFDAEVIAGVLGPLHTLKGNSGMMGFSGIKDYVHRLEDVFAQINEGGLKLSATVFDALFAGASALRDSVEKSCEHAREARDLAPERGELESLLATSGTGGGHVAAPLPTVSSQPHLAPLPAPAPVAAPAPPTASAPPLQPKKQSELQYVAARSNMLRVDFGQLDQLLNLVGELIIFRTKLHQMGRDLAEEMGNHESTRELLDTVTQVAGISTQLQETVMDIRMLPIRHVFERFPRMIRDLARSQGKEIELIVEGEATRIDKAIIDEIGEPLVHMLRNSIDHGIEPPHIRMARGKTPTGTILLAATQESNHVLITIMDDGGGIDVNEVKRKAVKMGLLKGDEALSDREIVQLVFSPGFSTTEHITDLSGRGVGLDVVLKAIERLNGLVEVETVPGVGTKFTIQLPLTLAIISALLVEVGTHTYAIPLSVVVESIKYNPNDVHHVNGRPTLVIRDRIIPLLRVADLLDLGGEAEMKGYAVIVGRGDKRVGLLVDRLRGQQEVVIKALDAAVAGATMPAVAGATIMGDGRVVLILDVAAFFEGRRHTLIHGRAPAAGSPPGGA
jgi:two-component system chemotaxis sensor kinase CheA